MGQSFKVLPIILYIICRLSSHDAMYCSLFVMYITCYHMSISFEVHDTTCWLIFVFTFPIEAGQLYIIYYHMSVTSW